ncbi:hypothetical protein ACQ4PT_067062 [Festuca glaucescens]
MAATSLPCQSPAIEADNAFPVLDTKTLGLTVCAHPAGQKVYPKPVFASRRALHDSVHQLHPDGRTLFVSEYEQKCTFSLDTENLSWRCQGSWLMPFKGQAYFDDELDAWVGLCRHKGGIGYVCSCDVATVDNCGSMPAWKLGKDQLFSADDERHLGATLLYMGNNTYCLIESLLRKHNQPSNCYRDLRRSRVLHVTKFGLKYDKNGELRTTRLSARSYEMVDGHKLNELCSTPVAFWM